MIELLDSLNPEAIPDDAEAVASYDDGSNAPPEGWEARFPNARVLHITRLPGDNTGDILDGGDNGVTPQQAVEWVRARRASLPNPWVYINEASWSSWRAAFVNAGVAEPGWWVAWWNHPAVVPPGAVALQYQDSRLTGGDFDRSVVAPGAAWPDGSPVVEGAVPHPVAPPPPAPAPGPGDPPRWVLYVVVEGDNMSVIADRHGVTLAQLEAANPHAGHPVGNFSDIWPGDHLLVPFAAATAQQPAPQPAPADYVVVEGDNMSEIAERHGVTLAQLEAANPQAGHPAGNFADIWPGDRLTIPSANG